MTEFLRRIKHNNNNLTRAREGAVILQEIFRAMKTDADRKHFADKLAQLRFVDSAKAVLTKCEVLNQPPEISTEIIAPILGILQNASNISVSICEQVVEKEIHPLLVREIKRSLSSLRQPNMGNLGREIMGDRIMGCLGALHNTIQLFPDARLQIHTAELQEMLIQLVQSTDGTLKIYAIMTLCVVVDSQNNANILKVEFSLMSMKINRFFDFVFSIFVFLRWIARTFLHVL